MPSNMTAIWILCVTFCVFLLLRFPVALVLVISSIATLWYLDMPIVVVAQQTLQGINLFSLLAIPFFILTGQLLGAGGLATRIVDFANVFVGRLPGGLSIVNSVACMFFGNLSGSAVADTSAIGSVMIPIMVKKGYSPEYSVGVTISSAIQGVVVPPSHNLVLYSIVAATVVGGMSVGKLFMAGIVPGFLLLGTLSIVGVIISIKRKYPKGDPVERRKIPLIILNGFLSLTPAVLILGSIIFGVATATEAGALAVVYSFCLGFFVYRELKPKHLWPVLVRTFRTVFMVFFLIGASGAFGYVMTILRLPDLITQGFLAISETPWVILLMINILLLLPGRAHGHGPDDRHPDAHPAAGLREARNGPDPVRPRPDLQRGHGIADAAGRYGSLRGLRHRQGERERRHEGYDALLPGHDDRSLPDHVLSSSHHVAPSLREMRMWFPYYFFRKSLRIGLKASISRTCLDSVLDRVRNIRRNREQVSLAQADFLLAYDHENFHGRPHRRPAREGGSAGDPAERPGRRCTRPRRS